MFARPPIFTLDLEDHTHAYSGSGRYRDNTGRLLDALDALDVKGTVFVVGRIAEAAPDLVKEVSRRGHEIACHSYAHAPLERETPASFRNSTGRAKSVLEQCAGAAVVGYRAPYFSLTPKTVWAQDELHALGFQYSSSVLPAANPIYGYRGAPRTPFRWPNGLVEIPVPVAGPGPVKLPYLGGIYFRYLPLFVARYLLARAPAGVVPWVYLHPYDIDAAEGYSRLEDTPLWVNHLLLRIRKSTLRKLAGILSPGEHRTLAALAADRDFVADLPVFDPD